MNRSNTSPTSRLEGASAVIAGNRYELVTASASISGFFPNGWAIQTSSGGSRSNPRADVEILRNDQRIMRMTVDAQEVKFIPVVAGLSEAQMNKMADTLAKAIECHLEAKAEKAAVPADLAAAIDSLDVEPSKTWRMSMAGRPEAVLNGAFSYGPGPTDVVLPWMKDGDILVVKRGAPDMPEPVIESWSIMRGGKIEVIDEAEVRQLAGCAPAMEL